MPTLDTTSSEEVIVTKELGFDPENAAEGYRILEFKQDNGELYRIQIAGTQRFTYGPFAPGGKNGYGSSDNALRIYEGANKDNQLAVFRGVASVRDVGVPMVKMVKKVKSEDRSESGAAGSKSETRVERDVEYVAV